MMKQSDFSLHNAWYMAWWQYKSATVYGIGTNDIYKLGFKWLTIQADGKIQIHADKPGLIDGQWECGLPVSHPLVECEDWTSAIYERPDGYEPRERELLAKVLLELDPRKKLHIALQGGIDDIAAMLILATKKEQMFALPIFATVGYVAKEHGDNALADQIKRFTKQHFKNEKNI